MHTKESTEESKFKYLNKYPIPDLEYHIPELELIFNSNPIVNTTVNNSVLMED